MPGVDAIPDDLTDLVGETIEDAYRLDEVIGAGGMGVVFAGEQLKLKRPVAVKLLDPNIADPARGAERFRREAESVARLDHVNCLQVYDYGTTALGIHYMVMPWLSGSPLSVVLRRGNMPPRRALELTGQVLAGLEHAHGHGVVHRDLKPANIFVVDNEGEESIKIVDFGIAKIMDADADFQTRTGVFFGTPAYMSPEQAVGEAIDARSDLFAVGIVLYRMIEGDVPNRGRSVIDQMRKRATLDIPPLPAPCPPEISALVSWLCAREVHRRCPDATTARARLAEVLAGAPEAEAAWDEPYKPTSPHAPGGVTLVEESVSVTALDSIGISTRDLSVEPGSHAVGPPSIPPGTAPSEEGRASPDAETVVAASLEHEVALRSASRSRGTLAALAGAVALSLVAWGLLGRGEESVEAAPVVPSPVEPVEPAPAAAPTRMEPQVQVPAEQALAGEEPDLLEKLARVNGDDAASLPIGERHALLDELRANPNAARLVDETSNAVLDLQQARDAEAPCEVFLRALDTVSSSRARDARRALRRARVPAGEGPACAEARRKLGALKAAPKPADPDEAPSAEPDAPAPPRPGEITPKVGGLK